MGQCAARRFDNWGTGVGQDRGGTNKVGPDETFTWSDESGLPVNVSSVPTLFTLSELLRIGSISDGG